MGTPRGSILFISRQQIHSACSVYDRLIENPLHAGTSVADTLPLADVVSEGFADRLPDVVPGVALAADVQAADVSDANAFLAGCR